MKWQPLIILLFLFGSFSIIEKEVEKETIYIEVKVKDFSHPLVENLHYLYQYVINPFKEKMGCDPTVRISKPGYKCKGKYSQHCDNQAWDLDNHNCDHTNKEHLDMLLTLPHNQIIFYDYAIEPTHLHISYVHGWNKSEILFISKYGTRKIND